MATKHPTEITHSIVLHHCKTAGRSSQQANATSTKSFDLLIPTTGRLILQLSTLMRTKFLQHLSSTSLREAKKHLSGGSGTNQP
jgi:hypothetical protein